MAADLTGETFAQAWLSRHRFRDRRGGSALPWLLGIAQNLLNESRHRRDLSYEEVARRLEIQPAAARLRVSRALRRLSPFSAQEEL